MGANNKKQTIGYWFRMLYHFGWSQGPIDAFLEFRAGDRAAWKGELTSSGRIFVDAPNLFGGEKAEGGLRGDFDVMMGEATQQPNDYLAAQLGPEQSAYRGKASGVWRGGRYGAMNPYPKPASFKLRRILKGWDDDTPWYPETAEILMVSTSFDYNQDGWKYRVEAPGSSADYSAADYDDSGWLTGQGGFGDGGPAAGIDVGTYISSGVAGKGIWIRRTFTMDPGSDVQIDIYHDDGAWLWWNGEAIAISPTENYFFGTAVVPGSSVMTENVVVLKVLDSIPAGSPTHIFAGLTCRQEGNRLLGMNGAHILYDTLTSVEMQGEPVGLINEASFRAAADKLYAEGFGLCMTYEDGDIDEFQQRVCDIIGGCLSQSLVDGQYYLDLIRGDYVLADLPVITEDDVLEFSQVPTDIGEVVNQIIVEWFDPQTKTKRTTAPIQSPGAIRAAGGVRGEVRSYPEIPTEELALRVGARDLQAAATPTSKFALTTNRRAGPLRPGQAFRLQMPSEGIADMVCIVSDYDGGTLTSGKVKINAVQDVFGMPDTVYVQPQPGLAQPPDTSPVRSPHQALIEAPYVELAAAMSRADLDALPTDAGLILAMATRATNGVNYHLYSGALGEDLEEAGFGDWCPSAVVIEEAGHLDTSFTLRAATDLGNVPVGSWALWGEEIVRVDALDAEALTMAVGRGCADTVPEAHAAGSRIYFCGDWGATDGREYVDGETVSAKLLTRTSTAEQSLASGTALTVTMDQRQYRPYPPAQLTINGEIYPGEVYGDVEVAWVPRDRLMQADKLIDCTMAGIGPEPGTTWSVRCYIDGALDSSADGLTSAEYAWTPSINAGTGRVEVRAVRGGLESRYPLNAEFSLGETLWTPAILGALVSVWLDDQSPITASGGQVSQWNNRGALGWHFSQATASLRPTLIESAINGLRALRFDGVNDCLVSTAGKDLFRNVTKGWSFAVLCKRAEATAPTVVFGATRGGSSPGVRFAAYDALAGTALPGVGGRRVDGDAFGGYTSATARAGTWYMRLDQADWSTQSASLWIDGALDGTATGVWPAAGATSNTEAGGPLSVGAVFAGSGFSAQALANDDVAVVISGAGAFPEAADIDRLFGWAAWRFGLVDQLPAEHPYKAGPPTVDSEALRFFNTITSDAPYLWYRLDEVSGTTIADRSGNGRVATISGTSGTSYSLAQAGLVGDGNKAIKLLADTGYIRTVSTYSFPTTGCTLMICFQANAGAAAGVLTSWSANASPDTVTGARDRGFVLGSDGKLYFTFWDGSASRRLASLAAVNDGQPRIAHVIVGATSTRLLINGVLQQTIPYVPGLLYAGYYYIGRTNVSDQSSPINTNAGFRGVVDEAVLFTTELSDARALEHAQTAGLAPPS